MNDRVKYVHMHLRPDAEMILQHPLLTALDSGSLSREILAVMFWQVGIYRDALIHSWSALDAQSTNDSTRISIIGYLWEQLGSGNVSQSLGSLFRQFQNGLLNSPEAV